SGLWTNDNPVLNPTAEWMPIATNGGSVGVSGAKVLVEAGSLIDVSSGAWRSSSGALSLGKGGSVSFATTGAGLTIDGTLFAHGGSLSISAPYICITASACPEFPDSAVLLSPNQFAAGSFESYSFKTSFAFRVASDGVLDLKQHNLATAANVALIPTGTPVS